jgi:hypothetical protein
MPSRKFDDPYSPVHVKGIPFTARWQHTVLSHGKVVSRWDAVIARASNGSTYMAILGPEGTPTRIEIDDVPNNRMVTTSSDHTYVVSTPQGGSFQLYSAQEFTSGLLAIHGRDVWRDSSFHLSPLGVKQEDGMTLSGQKIEFLTQVTDVWFSTDLCVRAIETQSHPFEESAYEYTAVLTEVRREEPEPKLFMVPDGYQQIAAAD